MKQKIITTITINTKNYAKFKSICALKNSSISTEIEKMIFKFIKDYEKREDKKNENKK